MTRYLLPLAATLTISGCAIHQKISPVSELQVKQICVIENPAVREGFLSTYRLTLAEKGYDVRVISKLASSSDCPITSTYTANWRWDLALYLAYAEIKVYDGGKLAGEAVYDALSGGANLNKFIRGEEKIKELVNELFPRRAGQ
ncbi:MAG: Sbal_3080 family lipoprotein [Burkholderiales bacterium]